jgi:CheY-like chemotaxis protein
MMDWKMPEMDGFEVSRKIRQELKLAVPIIMMTAFGQEEQRIEAEAAGIDGFLTKPIYPSTLFDAVMDAFGKESAKEGGRKRRFTTRASIYRKPLKGLRMLVAEDNPTNQEVAQAILEGAGISVTIVGNGQAAVEAVRTGPFDAVLMDIQMPVLNGYEATRLIREQPQGKDLPIVAMTAHAMKGDEEKCLDAGMDGYVAKPVDQDRLFHTLWRLLRHSKRLPEAEMPEEELPAEAGIDQRAFPEQERTGPADIVEKKGSALPDRLPGIDIENTLAAMNIDPATVRRILSGFCSDNRHTAEKIRQAYGKNDLQALRQLAHSLKGSAASIGAEELKEAARVLENVCQQGAAAAGERPDLDSKIATLEGALDQVLTSIRSLDESTDVTRAPVPAPAEACLPLDAVLAQLAEALEQADPEPVNQLMPVLRQAAARCTDIDGASFRTLEEQVGRYDYDQAMETIRKMRQDR